MTFTATQLQDAVALSSQAYGKFENRMSEYGALQAFIDNAGQMFPGNVLSNIKNSNRQPVKIPMLKRGTAPEITARACTITGQTPDSEFITLSWGTTGFEIKIIHADYADNYIGENESFAMQMANGLRTVLAVLDTAGYNALESNKNTGLLETGLPGVTLGAGYYQFENAVKLYQFIQSVLAINDIPGMAMNIASQQARASLMGMLMHGAANDVNEAMLLNAMGLKNYFSNRVLNAGGIMETHYLVPAGGIGMFTWNGFEAKKNMKVGENQIFYTQDDPVFGLTWDVMETTQCAAHGSFQRAVSTTWQFNIDYAFLTQYSSSATLKPIVKAIVPIPAQ